jgi:hypothetical protein
MLDFVCSLATMHYAMELLVIKKKIFFIHLNSERTFSTVWWQILVLKIS